MNRMNLLDLDNDCLNIIGNMVKKDNEMRKLELKKSCYKWFDKKYYRITDIGLTMLKEVGLKPTDVTYEINPYIENNEELEKNYQVLSINKKKRTEKKMKDYNTKSIYKDPYYTTFSFSYGSMWYNRQTILNFNKLELRSKRILEACNKTKLETRRISLN